MGTTWMHALIACSAALLAGIANPHPGSAEQYPSQPIHLVVTGTPGTPPDTITRIVANDLSQDEGWRVLVENKVGAMQMLGAADVLKQAPDGHTVLAVAMAITVAPALLPKVSFRLENEFVPVVKLATAYHVLVVNPSVPAKTLGELVALLKREPDKFSFSSGGFGTPAHMAGELFKLKTGVRAQHVPYQSLPRAIGDLLNGTNQYQFITPLPVLDLIATGKLRALAVTAPSRMAAFPDVPTVVEEGFPELIVQDWIGLLVRRGTPDDVILRLNTAVNKSLATPRVRKAIAILGAEAAGGGPDEFRAFFDAQIAYWGNIVRQTGLRIQQ